MIYILDDALDEVTFGNLRTLLAEGEYREAVVGGKSFWIQMPPAPWVVPEFCERLAGVEGKFIEPILAFFRRADAERDTDWRIHADGIIAGKMPDRAMVYYITEPPMGGLTGTAFYRHVELGHRMAEVTGEAHDRILEEDSEEVGRWEVETVVGHRQNRLVSYPAEYFHSKYPNVVPVVRDIFVMFYRTVEVTEP